MMTQQSRNQEPDTPSREKENQPSLIERIFKFKALIVCLVLLILGILLLIIASLLPEQGLPEHLLRDIGIVLVTTGLVVFAADYITRKDFLAILSQELNPLIAETRAFRQSTLNEMEPLRRDVSSLTTKLLEEVKPLRQDIPTLSTALDDIRKCISLGATMSVLGIKQIHDDRRESSLLERLKRVKAGSEIKILGIVASEIGRVPMPREKIQPGQVELRYYDSTPRYFLFITDSVVIVGFYLGRIRGADGPHLELDIKERGIATAFIEHFDSLWELGKPPL
ncbi:MAG: hypothetical protein DMF68_02525 [Acidobacteria bacterium]|nr:MAG: hypothetical protein DMF68_02525 [Acidobacteriota bacterium]